MNRWRIVGLILAALAAAILAISGIYR